MPLDPNSNPDWEPPPPPEYPPQTPQPDPEPVSASYGGGPVEHRLAAPLEGTPIPICYGRVFLNGLLGVARSPSSGSELLMTSIFCVGEIDGFEKIYLEGRDGVILSEPTHGATTQVDRDGSPWTYLTPYFGKTTQTTDTQLSSRLSGFDENYVYTGENETVGMSYLVIRQQSWGGNTPAVASAYLRAMKCFDNRVPSTAYTTNPVLHLADYVTQPYGGNVSIDWDSVDDAADRADTLLGGLKRWEAGTIISAVQDVSTHIERLRAIAGVTVRVEGATVYLDAVMPSSSVTTFDMGDMVKGSVRVSHKDLKNAPSVVEVEYSRYYNGATVLYPPETAIATYKESGVDAGTVERRTTRVTLRDAIRHEIAYRYARQQHHFANFSPWVMEFETRVKGVQYYQGQVITVEHDDLPGASTDMLVTRNSMRRQGRTTTFAISCEEYDASNYRDDDVGDTAISDVTENDLTDPPQVTGLTITDEVPQDRPSTFLRLRIIWTGVDWPYLRSPGAYRVVITSQEKNFEYFVDNVGMSAEHEVVSGPINENEDYKVEVSTRGALPDVESTAVSTTYTPIGKLLPPPDVSALTATVHSLKVTLRAKHVFDLDLAGYEFRVGSVGTAWTAMSPIASPNTPSIEGLASAVQASNWLAHFLDEEPSTALQYSVKAVDLGGRYSDTEATIQVAIDDFSDGPDVSIEYWPRQSADWAQQGSWTSDSFDDVILPGDGWYGVSCDAADTMVSRLGTTSPAANTDKLPHAYNNSYSTVAEPRQENNVDPMDFTADAFREVSWQASVWEVDGDGADVTSIRTEKTGALSGYSTPTVRWETARMTHANLRWGLYRVSFLASAVPDAHYGLWQRYPVMFSVKKKPLLQTGSFTDTQGNYPKTVTWSNEKEVGTVPAIKWSHYAASEVNTWMTQSIQASFTIDASAVGGSGTNIWVEWEALCS